MSLPRYPEYKDSGVDWLGEAPKHWGVKRLRFVAELNPSKSEIADLDKQMPISFMPMDAIGDDGTLNLEREKNIAEVETGYTYFRDGDVTVAKITPCFENGKGAVMRGLLNGIGFGTTELIVARPKASECTGEYLHWLFISTPFRKLGESHMYGAGGQKRVPNDFVRDFAIAFPNTTEQKTIAAFLDRETRKIDALIAEQKRLVDLLAEKRQAVISHAVTKGLNPKVPMKNSGIDWLGEVPVHWGVTQSRRMFAVRSQPALVTDRMLTASQKHGVLFQSDYVELEGRRVVEVIMGIESLKHVEPDDFIISMRSFQGGIEWCKLQGSTSFHYVMIKPIKGVYPPFFAYLFKSVTYIQALRTTTDLIRDGQELRFSNFAQVDLPFVPMEEQKLIVSFLDSETAKLDTLTVEANRAIELLQERRGALISAAVTGKIDVRTLVPSSQSGEGQALETV